MNRLVSVIFAATVVVGCSSNSTDPASENSPPPQTTSTIPTASTFAGVWRSTTPLLEFVRLTVDSKSSEQGALAARLTYSGVVWEGSGRIEGDAFVANMSMPGASASSGVLTARVGEARTLRVIMRPANGASTELTFVRDN